MIPIVTIDDNYGVSFNDRRQSRDSVLCQYLVEYTKDSVLWMNEYSGELFFKWNASHVQIDDDFLVKAGSNEYCFMEKESFYQAVEKLIVCRWNRVYPADLYLGLDAKQFKIKTIGEITGKSHEKITIEEWNL